MTTPGSISFKIFSIPFLRVIVDDGQPLQAPCNITLTTLFFLLYESKRILPPSDATAGLTYSSKICIIFFEVMSVDLIFLFLLFELNSIN